MVIFANRRPVSLYERVFVIIPFMGHSVQRTLLSEDGTCLQQCDCSWLLLLVFSCKQKYSSKLVLLLLVLVNMLMRHILHVEKNIACWFTIACVTAKRHDSAPCIGDGSCK